METISKNLTDARFIPILSNKHPAVAKGEDWNNLTLSYAEANEKLKDNLNVGIVAGLNGYLCLDCDRLELYQAAKTLLPETYEEEAISGGYHLIYKTLAEFSQNIFDLKFNGEHLGELRVKRAYLLIYPSQAINKAGVMKQYKLLNDVRPAEVTKEQIESLLSTFDNKTFDSGTTINNSELMERASKDAEIKKLLEGDITGYPSRSEAEQALVDKLVCRDFTKEEIFSIMPHSKTDKWNEKPLSYRNKTFEKALSYATIQKAGSEQLELLKIYSADEYKKLKPNKDYLIKGIIYPKEIRMTYAPSGHFKSLFCLYEAVCIASGKKFLDKFKVKPSNVLYVSAENSKDADAKRLKTILRGLKIRKKIPLYFLPREETSDIMNFDFRQRLFKTIKEKKITLLYLDTINPLTSQLDDNKARDVTLCFNLFLKPLCDNLQCHVNFLHHTDKGEKGSLGSVKWIANSDVVMRLERDNLKPFFKIFNEKNRSGESNTLHIGIEQGDSWTKFNLMAESNPEKFSKKKKMTQAEFFDMKLNELVKDKSKDIKDIMNIFLENKIRFKKSALYSAVKAWREA